MIIVNTITEFHESEKDFASWFEDFCDLHRWTWRHISDSRREVRGKVFGDEKARDLPDYFLVRERVVFVELKGWRLKGKRWERGELTDGQRDYLAGLQSADAEVYVVWPENRGLIEAMLA